MSLLTDHKTCKAETKLVMYDEYKFFDIGFRFELKNAKFLIFLKEKRSQREDPLRLSKEHFDLMSFCHRICKDYLFIQSCQEIDSKECKKLLRILKINTEIDESQSCYKVEPKIIQRCKEIEFKMNQVYLICEFLVLMLVKPRDSSKDIKLNFNLIKTIQSLNYLIKHMNTLMNGGKYVNDFIKFDSYFERILLVISRVK